MQRFYRVGLICLLLSWAGLTFFGLCTIPELRFDDPIHLQSDARLSLPWKPALKQIWTTSKNAAYTPVTLTTWYALKKISVGWGSFQPLYIANWAIHLAATAIVLLILAQLFSSPMAAFWGALFFGIHPMHVEPVAWITGLRDVLSGALALGSLLFYLLWAKQGGWWRLLIAWVVFTLALLSKPNIAFFWLAFSLVALPWKGLRAQWVSIVLWLLFLPVLFFQTEANTATADWLLDKSSATAKVLIALDAITFYLAKAVFPLQTAFDYGRTPARALASAEIFITAALPVIVFVFLKKWNARRLAGMFVLALLPSLGLIPFIHQHISTVADRYAYCALLALAIAVGAIVESRPRAQWAACVVTVVLTMLTMSQVGIWMDREALLQHMVKVNPKSWLGHNSLASMYAGRANVNEAVAEFKLAIDGQDELRKKPEMLNLLGSYLMNQGRYFEAIRALQEAVELRPSFAKGHHNLGVAWMRLGAVEHAEDEFWLALTWDPKLIESREGLKEASRIPSTTP